MSRAKITVLIMARGGSKRLPGKNIRDFLEKPLLAYTIACAKKARNVGEIILSTDSEEIAKIGLAYGATVPFIRPSGLAKDMTTSRAVILYTINRLNRQRSKKIREVVLLQPTSPLRTSNDVDKAFALFKKVKAGVVISVCAAPYPPSWNLVLGKNWKVNRYSTDQGKRQAGVFRQAYYPNGAIYIFNCDYLKRRADYYSSKTYAYVMPRERSIDIDDEHDFKLAECLYNKGQVAKLKKGRTI